MWASLCIADDEKSLSTLTVHIVHSMTPATSHTVIYPCTLLNWLTFRNVWLKLYMYMYMSLHKHCTRTCLYIYMPDANV